MTQQRNVVGVTGMRVMAVYGHPDDEGQVTGTLGAFVAAGNEVTLVCATRGEVGEISDPALSTPETLWYTRELELRAAMAQIGVRDVRYLGFRDSGMVGTPENEDPRSLHQQPPHVGIPAVLAIMREVRPHFVFTWQPDGGYGHPDHIAIHMHTVAAFEACNDASAYPEAGESWSPQRLYWGARTMRRMAEVRFEMERRGLLPEPMNEDTRARLQAALEAPEAPASVVIDTCDLIAAKRRSSSMHRSQFGENSMWARVPDDLQAQVYGEERFWQARPEWREGDAAHSDFNY